MLGTRLADRYELKQELGRGGMGVVYRAWDPRLGRDVAVKLIPPLRLGGDDAERFRREARMVAQLDHPSIVPIHDYGQHDEALFFVMPLVEGTTLRDLLEKHRLPLGETVEVAAQMAEALDYSHARGVIHRDVKPENVMVGRERGDLRVRMMDFGLARNLGESRLSHSEGLLVGTPAYLSPEQVGGARADYRSDLYAVGVVVYECLAGHPPFHGPLHATLEAIGNQPPKSFEEHGVEVDEELSGIVSACLAKRPSDRPATGKELAAALRSYSRGLRSSERTRVVRGERRSVARLPRAPLIGRSSELGELLQRFDRASEGRSQVVLVAGEAGLGKTRLLGELVDRARERGVRVLQGRASDSTGGSPFQWFCELVQDFFEQPSTRNPPLSDLAADLVTLFPVLSEIAPLREAAVGRGDLDPRWTEPGSETTQGEAATKVFELLARTLTRLTGERPMVLAVENIHLGESAAEALCYLVPRLAPTPTLVVATYRPSEVRRGHPTERLRDALRDDPRYSEVVLEPLGRDDLEALVADLVGSDDLAPSLIDELADVTEGNPLFLRELVRSLQESGEIRRDDSGGFVLTGGVERSTRALPTTLQQAIERRLDRLDAGPRQLLAKASVLGRRFEDRDLEELVDDADHFEADLDRLIDQGLLEEEDGAHGDRLAFTSRIEREVIYKGLSRRRRRALHRARARALEGRTTGRRERQAAELLHHFYEGDDAEKTVEYALLTARTALEAWSPEEAIRACRKGLEFAEEDEVDDATRHRAELWHLVARAHLARGRISDALRRAEKAYAAFRSLGDDARAADCALLAARVAWRGRRSDATRRWSHQGRELARRVGATDLLRELLTLGATAASLRGEHSEAGRLLAEAESLVPEADEPEVAAGGQVVAMLPGRLQALDPSDLYADWQKELAALVFDTLFDTDESGQLVPALALEVEAETGAQSFKVRLRHDVRFADGEPLVAAHVAASFEHAARTQTRSPVAALGALLGVDEVARGEAKGLRGVEVLDDHRLRLRLREPMPVFPALLTDPGSSVVRWVDGQPVGTGPFRLATRLGTSQESEAEHQALELVPNPHDWGKPSVKLERIVLRSGLDSRAASEELRRGSLDLGRDLSMRDLDALLSEPRFRSGLVEAPRRNVYFALFQSRRGPAAERDLRRALCGVVRCHDLVWRTLGRLAQPAVGLLPPGILGHDAGRRIRRLSMRRAQQLVRRIAGGERLRLRTLVQPVLLDRHREVYDALAELWGSLGVELDLVAVNDDTAYLERWEEPGDVDLVLGRWNADYPDPDNFTHYLFHSERGLLRRFFGSEKSDRLLERARRESRIEPRRALYRRFEDLLLNQAVLLPLFHDIDYRLAGPAVRGLRLGNTPPYVDYRRLGRRLEDDAELPPSRVAVQGRARIPLVGRVETLDPVLATSLEQAEVVPNVFETLTRVHHDAQIVPWLAESFEVDDSGQRFHFRLRRDVRFHDGRRLTARDVRYSFERVLTRPRTDRPRLPIVGAELLESKGRGELTGLEVLSADELVIELDQPLAFFPALLTHPSFAIVPEDTAPADDAWVDGSWRDGCVGTGPFRVVRFESGGRIDLEAHPGYWRPQRPACQKLVFHGGMSSSQVAADFKAGRLALASDLLPEDLLALRHDPTFGAGYQEAPRLSTYFLALNVHRGPFADPEVRRAFAAALVLDTLVEEDVGPVALRAEGLLPPGLLGHEAGEREARRGGRGSLAGLCVQLAINPAFEAIYGGFWSRLKEAFQGLGIEMIIQHGSAAELVDVAHRGEVDLVAQRWIADYPDPDNFFKGLLDSQHGMLGALCGRQDLDGLIELGRGETDPGLRHAVYREIEDLIAREVLLIPLFHEQAYRIAHPSVTGLRLVGLALPEVRYDELSLV